MPPETTTSATTTEATTSEASTTGATTTEAAKTTAEAPPAPFWYPVEPEDGSPSYCQFGNDYPAAYSDESSIALFETEDECCTAYNACQDATTSTEAPPTTEAPETSTTEGPTTEAAETTAEAPQGYWYPTESHSACVNGEGYPVDWEGLEGVYLFQSEGDCCEVWCHDTGTGSTDDSPVDPVHLTCEGCEWHESITSGKTCSNSPNYPSVWDEDPAARSYHFFHTAEECCETRFPGDCTIEDSKASGSSGFTPLGPSTVDDFEQDAVLLPFDFGTPPQWQVDESGVSNSGSKSVTNIPAVGLSARSDLTLKIRVSNPSTVMCMGKVDISMPFDFFSLVIDGNPQIQYHQVMAEGWIGITAGIGPGDHEIIFRVENAPFDAGMARESHFGSGHVYLDDCRVVSAV